jgi:hypothetical protein
MKGVRTREARRKVTVYEKQCAYCGEFFELKAGAKNAEGARYCPRPKHCRTYADRVRKK